MSEQLDLVNHPPHYRHPSGEQCITFSELLGFNVGNALKYVWRQHEKGDRAQNLDKAVWYLNRAIESPLSLPRRSFSDVPAHIHGAWASVAEHHPEDDYKSFVAMDLMWVVQFVSEPAELLEAAHRTVTSITKLIGAAA